MRRFVIILMLFGAAAVSGQTPVEVGKIVPYQAESPHPYPVGAPDRPAVWTERIVSPGATFLRIHFAKFDLAQGDYVTVRNPDGSQFWTYTDKGLNGDGEFWSFAVDGDTAIIEIHAGATNGHGFKIDQIGPGTVDLKQPKKVQPIVEVVCGTDGRENVACHTNEGGINAAQRAVARLLFTSGGLQYLCTGWLVRGSNVSTMLTNNHCFSTQKETSTVQAMFNYQYDQCTGGSLRTTTSYAGGTFLRTNSERANKRTGGGLDYTLFTLQGNPEGTWGEVIPTSSTVSVGQQIWFIQHPGGGAKKIGYFEDLAKTAVCNVDTVNATYGSAAKNSQIGYGCDSEGGSSGSPILRASDGKAIGLHHYGGVSGSPCLNSGTMMSRICADAGTLLICDSN